MSNVYPVWWDTVITVYNKHEDKQTRVVTWYRTVLKNCFWKYVWDRALVGQTAVETNYIICRIPKNEKFLDKYLWVELPNDQKLNNFTLGAGDLIVRGEVDDEISEHTSGMRSSDFISKYKKLQGCMEIREVAINVGPGRGTEHYRVNGI